MKRTALSIRFAAGNALLMVFYCIIYVVLLLMFSYLYQLYLHDINTDGTNKNNTIYFTVRLPETAMDGTIDFSFTENKPYQDVNLLIKPNAGSTVFEVVRLGLYDQFESGGAFTDDQYRDGKQRAVVGYQIGQLSKTIEYQGISYEIVGVLTDDYENLSYSSFCLNGNFVQVTPQSVFLLEAQSKRQVNKVYSQLSTALDQQGIRTEIIQMDNAATSDFLSFRKPVLIIAAFLFFLMMIMNAVVNTVWLYAQKRYLTVYFIIGDLHAGRRVFGKYACMNLCCMLTALAVMFVFHQFNFILFGISAITFGLSLLVYLISYFNFRHKHFNELLEISYE